MHARRHGQRNRAAGADLKHLAGKGHESWDDPDLLGHLGVASLDAAERAMLRTRPARGEQHYRALALAAGGSGVVWTAGPEGLALDMATWSAYTGQSVEACRGWGWLDALHPDDRHAATHAWAVAIERRAPLDIVHRVRRRDGVYQQHATRAYPVLCLHNGQETEAVDEWIGVSSALEVDQAAPRPVLPNSGGDAVGMVEAVGTILMAGPDVTVTLDHDPVALRGTDALDLVHPEDRGRVLDLLRRTATGPPSLERAELRVRRADGSWRIMDVVVTRGADTAGGAGVLWSARDVTAQAQAETALRESEARLRTLLEKAPVGASIANEDGVFEMVNDAYCAIYGYTREELIGRPIFTIVPQEQRVGVARLYGELFRQRVEAMAEYEMQTKTGTPITVLTKSIAVMGPDNQPRRATFTLDITARKQQEQRLAHAALHDTLTGLPNRVFLLDRLGEAMHQAESQETRGALLLIDLDHFKEVSDTLGHDVGDELLRQVAIRVQRALRGSDMLARLGGDEFAVLLPAADEAGALLAVGRVLDSLGAPVVVEGQPLEVLASVGVALYPEHGDDAATLLRHADIAMYVAKRGGDGTRSTPVRMTTTPPHASP